MGLFDSVICEYPIVGGLPAWIGEHAFQTNDLDCKMSTYTLDSGGRLRLNGEILDWTGRLTLYASNIVATGPGVYTEHGEDAEAIQCVATVVHGYIADPMTCIRTSNPALAARQQRCDEWARGKAEYDAHVATHRPLPGRCC